ncbi:MAG: diacylglycerol kinase catalytic region [Bacteroidota bacterium]|nr:diacylglycerol kinase catalytic region [Bacteroidota bacterium]
MKKVVFVFHGKVKRRDKLFAQIQSVFGSGYGLEQCVTEKPDHALELAYLAVKNGATHIICVGGDGSLNEIANGVMKARAEGFEKNDLRIGLLPHGTGNDFARTIHVTPDITSLKQLVDKDSLINVDLGLVNYNNREQVNALRYFINITDVGIGGAIAQRLVNSSKIFGPTVTYQKAIITSLLSYSNQPVKVVADSFSHQGKVMNFIVANGKYFGAGLGIAPSANATDGKFAIVVLGEISIWDYLKNLGSVKKCIELDHPEVKYLEATEIKIESSAGPLPIDMDGEFIGYSPMQISMVPGALRFLAPL